MAIEQNDRRAADALSYKTGIRDLGPLLLRIITLERTVTEQQTTIAALQSTVLALKHKK